MAAKARKECKKGAAKISPHAAAYHRTPSFIPSSSLCSLRSFAAKKIRGNGGILILNGCHSDHSWRIF
jgi:hypothetical protein